MPPSTWMQALATSTAPSKQVTAAATSAANAHCSSSARRSATRDRGDVPGRRGHRLRGLQHLGAQVLDRLEAADLLAELLAHLGVLDRRLQAPARHAGGLGGGERDRRPADQSAVRPGTGTPADASTTRTVPKRRLRSRPSALVSSTASRGRTHQAPASSASRTWVADGASHTTSDSARATTAPSPSAEATSSVSPSSDEATAAPEQRPRHQLVGARLEGDRHVEHRAAPATGCLGQADRGHAHLDAATPDVGERRLRVVLGGPRELATAQVRRPLAQAPPARRAPRRSRSTCDSPEPVIEEVAQQPSRKLERVPILLDVRT